MSAISGYISTIQNAVHGEQVRTAIINALEQCYSDVNSPSLQTEAFSEALDAAYAGGILDIQTVTSFNDMTNDKIIYRYNGTAAGKQKGLYYYSALSSSWVLIGSEIQKVSYLSQMTDVNDIYKYIGTESGMVQNSLYCHNGTAWVPIGSGILTASDPSGMTNTGAIYKYTGSTQSGYRANALYFYDGTEWTEIANISSVQNVDDKFSYAIGLKEIVFSAGYYSNDTATTININGRQSSSSGYRSALVPCRAGDTFFVSGTSGNTNPYAWAITTSNGTIITASGLDGAIVENEKVTIPDNDNARYLVINQKLESKSYFADSLRYFIDNVKQFADGSMYYLKEVFQGSYTSTGGFTDVSNRIRSAVIPVNAGATIKFRAGANAKEFLYGFSTGGNYSDSSWYINGSANITLPSAGNVILVFRRSNGADITPADFDAEVLIDTGSSGSVAINPTTYPEAVGVKTAEQYVKLQWTPKNKVPQQGGNAYWPANTQRTGMLYSEAFRIGKVVGFDVSLRTFMTALNDPYSLIYTENINADHSKSAYGITYNGNGNAGAYYGITCDEYTSAVLGCEIPYHNGDMMGWANEAGIFETVYDQSANGLQLLDVITNSGHARIVTKLWKADGETKTVQLSESIGNGVQAANYSAASFNSLLRTSGYTIVRYRDLYKNINYKPQNEFVAVGNETLTPYDYNDDICTFAGDYASFAEGDLLYLDYTKGSYSSVQIYKNDALLETIALDPSADVHQVNLTAKNYTYGKYKARLTDGTNNSEYCYWEILNGSASVSGDTLTATSSNATPVYWGWVNNTLNSAQKYLFDGETTADISAAHTTGYNNILVVFQGDYGRIRKVITP